MAAVIENFLRDIPVVTRTYMFACLLTTTLCALDILSPFSLYFNNYLIFHKFQIWRLFTNFFFFGDAFSIDWFFHVFFLVRYSRHLEEGSFHGRTADFFYMLLFGASIISVIAPFIKLEFLGSSLMFMLVYIWGRRNPHLPLNFLGMFRFTAPYLPWVLFTLSILFGSSGKVDLLGIFAGHLYYFLEDIYPLMIPSHTRILRTPHFIKLIFDNDDVDVEFDDVIEDIEHPHDE